jgi:hypothetical protein
MPAPGPKPPIPLSTPPVCVEPAVVTAADSVRLASDEPDENVPLVHKPWNDEPPLAVTPDNRLYVEPFDIFNDESSRTYDEL